MAEYHCFKFDTKKLGLKAPTINLYPIVCMHFGAAQSDYKFITEHVQRIKNDPNGFYIYMGDGGECVTKQSKGDIYAQLLSPQGQQDLAVEVLAPIKDRGLFGIRGNHGNRIYKETGLSFDKNLCHRLGIPYMGVSAFVNLLVNRSSYDLFFHHGSDSGTPLATKIRSAQKFTQFVDVDAVFTAHSHTCQQLPPQALMSCDNIGRKVKTKLRYGYICGCGYDSRTGYAEEKGYDPILPAYMKIEFDGRIIEGVPQKHQHSEVYRSDGQHALKHPYLGKYVDEPVVEES